MNLPNHVAAQMRSDAKWNAMCFKMLIAEDRMHRVNRWLKQLPKGLHVHGMFMRCFSAHHARAEKGSLSSTTETTMKIDEYHSQYEELAESFCHC